MKICKKIFIFLGLVFLIFPVAAMEQVLHKKEETAAQPACPQEEVAYLDVHFINETVNDTVVCARKDLTKGLNEFSIKPLTPGDVTTFRIPKVDFQHLIDGYVFTYEGKVFLLKFGKIPQEQLSAQDKPYYVLGVPFKKDGKLSDEERAKLQAIGFNWGDTLFVNMSSRGLGINVSSSTQPSIFTFKKS